MRFFVVNIGNTHTRILDEREPDKHGISILSSNC